MGRMGLGGALGNSRGVVGVSVRGYRMALAGFGVVLGGFLNGRGGSWAHWRLWGVHHSSNLHTSRWLVCSMGGYKACWGSFRDGHRVRGVATRSLTRRGVGAFGTGRCLSPQGAAWPGAVLGESSGGDV